MTKRLPFLNNLGYLLENHGHSAKIDVEETRKLMRS